MLRKSKYTLLLLVVWLGLIVSCDSNTAAPTPPAAMSNAELLKQAIANMRALKSYHVENYAGYYYADTIEVSDVDVSNQKVLTHYSSGTMGGANDQDVDMIYVDKHWYSQDNEHRKGEYYTGDCDDMGVFVQLDSVGYDFANPWDRVNDATWSKAGAELKEATPVTGQVDGTDTQHLVVDAKYLPFENLYGKATTATVSIWLTAGPKPIITQLEWDGSVHGLTHPGLDDEYEESWKWSELNQPFDIQPPKNFTDCGTPIRYVRGTPSVISTPVPTP